MENDFLAVFEFIDDILTLQPALVLFLILGLGYLVGNIRLGNFSFGPVAGVCVPRASVGGACTPLGTFCENGASCQPSGVCGCDSATQVLVDGNTCLAKCAFEWQN